MKGWYQMRKSDLLNLLEDVDDDAEVRLMHQPSWPFEYSIDGIWIPTSTGKCSECGYPTIDIIHNADHDGFDHDFEDSFIPEGNSDMGVVYLVEGTQLGYGDKSAWDEMERVW